MEDFPVGYEKLSLAIEKFIERELKGGQTFETIESDITHCLFCRLYDAKKKIEYCLEENKKKGDLLHAISLP